MAHIKYESFKDLIKRYTSLSNQYDSLYSRYMNDLYSLDTEDLFDAMYSFNCLYVDLKGLKGDINQQLNAIGLGEENYEKYISYINDIETLINSTITNYKTLKELKYSYASLSDQEDASIKYFDIDNK